MIKKIFLFMVTTFLLASCKTKDKVSQLNYMQNVEEIATTTATNTAVSTIQKNDQLAIFVSAKNIDIVRPFNQGSTATAPIAEKIYLVDSEGNIDFPLLGKVNTTGKTLEEFRNEMTDRVSYYVKNPTITARIVNFKITILGEVARPGQYTVAEGQSTLLNAIGLAGDLTMYGKRDDILMVRNEDGVLTKEKINLMDSNFINSPFFQLKQGDVIYVSANQTKDRVSRLDPNTSIYMAVAGTIIGLAGIFITIFKN